MKTSAIVAAVAGAALAAAQLDQIPTCALSCAITSIGASGCAQTDIACVCSASSFLSGILSCIQDACSEAEVEQTLGAAQVLCASAGVTITVPGSEPTSTSEAPAPSSTAEPTTEAPAPTSTEEATEEPTSYPTSSATEYPTTISVITMTTSTTYCPTTTHAMPTYVPPAANSTVPTTAAPPAYTGAAGSVVASAGTVILGAALAVLFA